MEVDSILKLNNEQVQGYSYKVRTLVLLFFFLIWKISES